MKANGNADGEQAADDEEERSDEAADALVEAVARLQHVGGESADRLEKK